MERAERCVLWDGIPMNDPFGGWVYWTRVPPEEIERIDVVRGGSSQFFGDRAMGGVISCFRASRPGFTRGSRRGRK